MLTIQVNTPTQDKNVLTTLGTISLVESVVRVDNELYSKPTLTVANVVISGLATDILMDLTLSETCAEDILTFIGLPTAGDTVSLSGITYTFIPAASGYISEYEVKIGTTTFGTALNFHKVLNRIGSSGTDYPASGIVHPSICTHYVNNPLTLRAIVPGVSGNSLTATTTSSNIILSFDKLYNGGIVSAQTISQLLPWAGSGIYTFDPVNYHPLGTSYEGTAKLFNGTDQLVTISGLDATYTLPRTTFYGKTSLNEFVEVPNLSGMWASNGHADSSGQFFITWDSPAVAYSGVSAAISAPGTTGTPTQTTRTITAIDAVQAIEYNIFVYTGSTAPERNWPRPVDANGTWYWAGRTTKTYAQVTVPSNTKGIWVGYGNKYTYATTVTNLNQISTAVHI